MTPETLRFALEHADDDVHELALRGCHDPQVDLAAALQQIAGRQTARRKMPTWAATEGLLYPPHLNMEQCSSEHTAQYKAEVLAAYIGERPLSAATYVDLTGGLGVDFSFMAQGFGRALFVERSETLCDLARNNLPRLGLPQAEVRCAEAQTCLDSLCDGHDAAHTIIYMDPARRDTAGRRTYAISDCTPDVLALLPRLLASCQCLLLKLSPMLDWHKAVADLQAAAPCHVDEVHVVEAGGECKELLVLLTPGQSPQPLRVVCTEGNDRFTFLPADDGQPPIAPPETQHLPGKMLLVPGAAVMKGGGFGTLCRQMEVAQLASNSHLMVADHLPPHWPGRAYRIRAVTTMNRQELRHQLHLCPTPDVSVRNFPLTAEKLHRRLGIKKSGGKDHVFATTLSSGMHILLWCCE